MSTDWNPSISPLTAARRLRRWGHFMPGESDGDRLVAKQTNWDGRPLRQALESYQKQYEQELTERSSRFGQAIILGEMDPYTEALLIEPRCSVPDNMQIAEANWPTACRDELTYARMFQFIAPLDANDTAKAFSDAIAGWVNKVMLMLKEQHDLGKNAIIWSTAGHLAGSTLAWSYLAMNSCAAHLEQRYNTSVKWTVRYLQAVACHEIGHALGLQHINDQRALMYPYARNEVYQPQQLDLDAMEALGYTLRTEPPEPPDPPEPPVPGPNKVQRVEVYMTDGTKSTLVAVDDDGTDW